MKSTRTAAATAVTSRSTRALSIFDPVFVGIDEFGQPIYLPMIYRNILIGGEPGSRKIGPAQRDCRARGAVDGLSAVPAGRQAGRVRPVEEMR